MLQVHQDMKAKEAENESLISELEELRFRFGLPPVESGISVNLQQPTVEAASTVVP